MPRREFLQLADTFNPAKHKIGGFFVSEKLDGTRAFWDGGITRGCRTEDVPWAGITDPKTGKRKAKIKPISTGLWSRYGNPIIAPDWFLNALPACPLDGELWAGRGNFQLCRSICGGDEPDPRFDRIQYAVYSTPGVPYVFGSGEIKNAQMLANIDLNAIEKFFLPLLKKCPHFTYLTTPATFEQELMFLQDFLESQNDRVFLHHQTKLPLDHDAALAFANEYMEKLLDLGAEGVVIRDGASTWTPKRHKGLLKYKPYADAEAEIIGFRAGKEGKQGNVLGKIGTLLVRTLGLKKNVEFEIGSGLSMAQREFNGGLATIHASANPGMKVDTKVSKHFAVGDVVTYKYRELSDDGIPKEGRFWRKRDAE